MSCSKSEIGERITELRKAQGLSQDALSKELHVSREIVAKWENGTRDLKTEHTIALANCFGISCDEILRGMKSENVKTSKALGLSEEAITRLQETIKDYEEPQSLDLFSEKARRVLKIRTQPNLLDAVNWLLEYEGEYEILHNLANYLFCVFHPRYPKVDESAGDLTKDICQNYVEVCDDSTGGVRHIPCEVLNEFHFLEAQNGLRKLRKVCAAKIKEASPDGEH